MFRTTRGRLARGRNPEIGRNQALVTREGAKFKVGGALGGERNDQICILKEDPLREVGCID